jgi:Domain of unknown function (DUF4157)
VLQRKLAVGSVNDPLEQEADRAADQVLAVRPPARDHRASGTVDASSRVMRKCAGCDEADEATVQMKPAVAGASAGPAPPIVHDVLGSPGTPLDTDTRTFMERRFGHSFEHVRVHTDARAADSASAMNALAYTVGSDVVFGAGRYSPGSGDGRRLLAHEMAHVVQQGSGATGRRVQRFVASETDKVAKTPEAMLTQIRQLIDAATTNGVLDWGFLVEISGGMSAGRQIDKTLGSADPTIKSRLLVRYLFSCRCGLLDMRHFMQLLYISNFATGVSQSEAQGNRAATGKGREHELTAESESRFGAEDTPSNALGAATNLELPGLPSPDQVFDAIKDTITRCDPVGWTNLSPASRDAIVHFYGDLVPDPTPKKPGDQIPKNQNQTAVPDILPINECGARERSFPFSLETEDSDRKTLAGQDFLGGSTSLKSAGDIRSFVDTQRREMLHLLPTVEKIRLLNRLLDGWVRDVDVEAFEKICASINTVNEADAVTDVLRPRADELNSNRQRSRVLKALYGAGIP